MTSLSPTLSRLASRSAALALAASLTLTMAACSSNDNASSSDGVTTLTMTTQNPDLEETDPALFGILDAFAEAHPEVKIEVSGQPVAEHLQSLSIAAQSDTLPDIFWVYKTVASDMYAADRLMDLGPLLDETGVAERLPESTMANFSAADGAVYGMPYQGLLTGLWYNQQILDEHGLEVPTTFDELLSVTETLHEAGVVTYSNGANQSAFSVWQFLVWLDRFGYGDRIQGILDGTDSYDNEDFVRMYQHIAELRDAGAFPSNVTTQTYQQAVDQFLTGNAAFLDAGVWAANQIQESDVAEHAGFWIGPEFSDGVGKQDIVMNVASAPFAVDHKVADNEAKTEALRKFIEFYYSDEAQQIMVNNGQPPVTTYEAQLDDSQNVLQAALDAASAPGVTSPEIQPDLMVPTTVANAMYDSIYGVIQDQLTPEEAVQKVQAAFETA